MAVGVRDIHGGAVMRYVLSVVVLLMGCATHQPHVNLEPACVRQCEQIWYTCRAHCPMDLGGSLGCTIAECNPARLECLDTCPNTDDVQLAQRTAYHLSLEGRIAHYRQMVADGQMTQDEADTYINDLLHGRVPTAR